MSSLDTPYLAFVIALAVQSAAVYAGRLFREKITPFGEDQRKDFDVVQAATLTLLALIIGFSFSMAITRYDQRKNYEEAEANAIGTEYLRADLLPTDDAARARELLRKYLDRRIAFYQARDGRSLDQIDAETGKTGAELWSTVLQAAKAQPTAVVALAVSGMNDVLNSQGYTAGRLVEPHPYCSMGDDGTDRNCRQCDGRLWRAQKGRAFFSFCRSSCRFLSCSLRTSTARVAGSFGCFRKTCCHCRSL
jgi:hypothetical protein